MDIDPVTTKLRNCVIGNKHRAGHAAEEENRRACCWRTSDVVILDHDAAGNAAESSETWAVGACQTGIDIPCYSHAGRIGSGAAEVYFCAAVIRPCRESVV